MGYADPFNRGTYPWGREDQGLVDFFRILGPLRRDSATLRQGTWRPLFFDQRCCVYLRELEGEAQSLLVAVNRSDEYLEIPEDPSWLEQGVPLLTVGSFVGIRGLGGQSGVLLALPPKPTE